MREWIASLAVGLAGSPQIAQAGDCWNARLELNRRRPTIVLLDEVLPGESSLDLLSTLIELKIPVILMTSQADRSNLMKGSDPSAPPIPEGAVARLLKPSEGSGRSEEARFIQELQDSLLTVLG